MIEEFTNRVIAALERHSQWPPMIEVKATMARVRAEMEKEAAEEAKQVIAAASQSAQAEVDEILHQEPAPAAQEEVAEATTVQDSAASGASVEPAPPVAEHEPEPEHV